VIFLDTPICGAYVIAPELLVDKRGAFARTFCTAEFTAQGLDPRVAQCNTSYNAEAGTLRGMHYQAAPHGEAKLVRCTRGSIYDVAVDVRQRSVSYRRWFALELNEESRKAFYIPAGCAHGFQTLCSGSEVLYQMSTPFIPDAGRGVRWDDPAFGIEWPDPPAVGRTLSERDAGYPDFAL
jgi:dTDP-4-dehydrorhamnose 3,5-epimerase